MVMDSLVSYLTSENLTLVLLVTTLAAIVWLWRKNKTVGYSEEGLAHQRALRDVPKRLKRMPKLYVTEETPREAILDDLQTDHEPDSILDRLRSVWARQDGIDGIRPRLKALVQSEEGVCVRTLRTHDANNDEVYFALIRGVTLAYRDAERLAGAVQHVATADLDDDDNPPATMAEYNAREMLMAGRVDEELNAKRCHADARTRLASELADEDTEGDLGIIDHYAYDDDYRYPPWVVEEIIETLQTLGIVVINDGRISFMRY